MGITSRQYTEKTLRLCEEQFQAMAELVPDIISPVAPAVLTAISIGGSTNIQGSRLKTE